MHVLSSEGIRVDGRLDEAIWRQAPPLTDFVQKEPVEGALPTERTEVRFVYDAKALYVGARMYTSGGAAAIQAPLGRRDGGRLAEYVLVSLDTFLDPKKKPKGVEALHMNATQGAEKTEGESAKERKSA